MAMLILFAYIILILIIVLLIIDEAIKYDSNVVKRNKYNSNRGNSNRKRVNNKNDYDKNKEKVLKEKSSVESKLKVYESILPKEEIENNYDLALINETIDRKEKPILYLSFENINNEHESKNEEAYNVKEKKSKEKSLVEVKQKVSKSTLSKKEHMNDSKLGSTNETIAEKEYAIPHLSFEEKMYEDISKKLDDKLEELEESSKQVQQDFKDYDWYIDKNIEDKEFYMSRKYYAEKELYEYRKAISSPYFGRLIVDSENGLEDIYIGHKTLSDRHLDNIVFDWRSSVCSLFYANQVKNKIRISNKTTEFYTVLKRRIRINNEKFIDAEDLYVHSSKNKICDEFLNEILKSRKNDSNFSDIIETIQSWQNDLIRADINENILCQGVAGCGKTAIILHRLSYLLFNYPKITHDKYLILCPSKLFKNNIGELNSKLGIDNIPMMTLNEYYWIKLEPFFEKKYNYQDVKLLADNSYIDKINNSIKKDYINFINNDSNFEYNSKETIYNQIKACRQECLDVIRKDEERIRVIKQLFDDNSSNTNMMIERLITGGYCDFSHSKKEEYYDNFREQEMERIKELDFKEKIDKEILDKYIEIYKYAKSIELKGIGKEKFSQTLFRIYSCLKYNTYNIQVFNPDECKYDLLKILNDYNEYFKKRDIDRINKLIDLNKNCENYLNVENLITNIISLSESNADYKIMNSSINSNLLKLILFVCSEIGFEINFRKENDRINSIVRKFRYVYIDEAQNYDNYDISIISKLENNKGLNIYGDLNQYLENSSKTWMDVIKPIKNSIKKYDIEYNYRNTIEVVNYCNKIFKTQIKAIGPNGNEVIEKELFDDFTELLNYSNYVFITNITSIYDYLKTNNKEIYYVSEIKGMEFSNVIVIDNNMNKAEKYVSYTRTLNDLIVYHYKNNFKYSNNKKEQAKIFKNEIDEEITKNLNLI